MSAEKLGQDCCGDRYVVKASHQCACCDECFCLSCYLDHCREVHESRVGKAKKR